MNQGLRSPAWDDAEYIPRITKKQKGSIAFSNTIINTLHFTPSLLILPSARILGLSDVRRCMPKAVRLVTYSYSATSG